MELIKESTITGSFLQNREQLIRRLYPEPALFVKLAEHVPAYYKALVYTILRNNSPVLSAVVFINEALNYQGHSSIALGLYESENDPEALNMLIAGIKKDFPDKLIIGPMNGSTWENYRFDLGQENPVFFGEQVLQPYYAKLFLECGFSEIARYESTVCLDLNYNSPKVLRREANFEGLVNIRSVDVNNLENELRRVFPLVVAAFRNNFLYTDISEDYFVEKYMTVKKYLDPEYMIIAEDKADHTIAAFILGLPDHFNTSSRGMIIKTLARSADKKYAGIGSVLVNRLTEAAATRGCRYIIHAFMQKENLSTNISGQFNSKPYREYVLYKR